MSEKKKKKPQVARKEIERLKLYLTNISSNKLPYIISDRQDNTRLIVTNVDPARMRLYKPDMEDTIMEVTFKNGIPDIIYDWFPIMRYDNICINTKKVFKFFTKLPKDQVALTCDEGTLYTIAAQHDMDLDAFAANAEAYNVLRPGVAKVPDSTESGDKIVISNSLASVAAAHKEREHEDYLTWARTSIKKQLPLTVQHMFAEKEPKEKQYKSKLCVAHAGCILSDQEIFMITEAFDNCSYFGEDTVSVPVDPETIHASEVSYVTLDETIIPHPEGYRYLMKVPTIDGLSSPAVRSYGKKSKRPYKFSIDVWVEKFAFRNTFTLEDEELKAVAYRPGMLWFPFEIA